MFEIDFSASGDRCYMTLNVCKCCNEHGRRNCSVLLVMFLFGSWTVWGLHLPNTLHYSSFGIHQPTYVIIRF